MWLVLACAGMCAEGGDVYAGSLDQRIPGLFGGSLGTTIQAGISEPHPLRFAEQFRSLSAALAAAHSQAPIPSASGAFRFAWDPELDTFVRLPLSLGSGLAERAPTLGRGTLSLNVSYTRVVFDTLEGRSLHRLSFRQSAISPALLKQLPPDDQARFGDDELLTHLDLRLSLDTVFLTAAVGVTDRIDVSLALSLSRASMRGRATTTIVDGNGVGDAVFVTDESGGLGGRSGQLCHADDLRCARDGFDDAAFATGDLFLRAKWHLLDTQWADFAVAGVLTLPTGHADDYVGFHDPTLTPWLIASKTYGPFAPHVNVGYAFRSGEDVSQAQWLAGADVRACDWLTLNADFLGFHDDRRDGLNDDVIQSALGFKLNPFGRVVLAGTVQLPLNRDGLRADVIYTGQIEYTF